MLGNQYPQRTQGKRIRHRLFLEIDRSAIAISNTEQSLHFYRDLLGMQVEC
ncbi:MAG: hypothetical protein V7K41_06195 [Nostoc sp.]|uniref:hypothetical protein n=1 Tax=Nostoc sp. TaxID=1180 RepID=UPI002FF6500D